MCSGPARHALLRDLFVMSVGGRAPEVLVIPLLPCPAIIGGHGMLILQASCSLQALQPKPRALGMLYPILDRRRSRGIVDVLRVCWS